MLRPSNALLRKGRQAGISPGDAGGVNRAATLQRERDGHLVAGMLARAARAVGPDFQRKLLLFCDAKAKSHEEQGFTRQAEHFVQSQRARVYEERFYQRLPYAAPLLIVA